MIQIDGSFEEGGGQILRTALSLSALTGQPFEISNIRKNRPKPGLRPQHLSCIEAVAQLCEAGYEGAELSSSSFKFYPHALKGRTLSIDIGTAGSVTLLLQSVLLPVIFGDKKFRIKVTGGTDVPFSPPSDYFASVLLPHLRKFCTSLEYMVLRRGFMPSGAGRVELSTASRFPLSAYSSFNAFLEDVRSQNAANAKLLKIRLTSQGNPLQVRGVSLASSDLQKAEVAQRQERAARVVLAKLGAPLRIESQYVQTESVGSVITLWALFSGQSDEVSPINPVIIGASCLGERAKRAEEVGSDAAHRLLTEINSKSPVDSYLADQLLPFLALVGGTMHVSRITAHCMANMYVIEQFLGKCFTIDAQTNTISALGGG